MKQLLFVRSHSVRQRDHYPMVVMQKLSAWMPVDIIWIEEYPEYDDSGYDCLIYNTFADEAHPTKYDRVLIDKTDAKFHKFSGTKLLLDSHDNGTVDGFERMRDRTTPRIKNTPGWDFMKEYNVLMGYATVTRWQFRYKGDEKTTPIMFVCNMERYPHNLRRDTYDRLKDFPLYTKRHFWKHYAHRLRASKICVSVAGTGLNGSSFGEALAANSVAFTHEIIKKIRVLPFGEMIDDVNYVSFNLDNATERMAELLKDEERIQRIAKAGNDLFHYGYDPARTATLLYDYLEGI